MVWVEKGEIGLKAVLCHVHLERACKNIKGIEKVRNNFEWVDGWAVAWKNGWSDG